MKILIPEHMWVGAQPKNITCEITAWGTDATSRKRMDTVATRVGGEQNCVKLENSPQVGFELVKSMWKDTHKVKDPRGFEFLINSHLLDELIKESTIVNGMVMSPCVYGRASGALMLLNTQGPTYAQAVRFTQVNQSKESWRNVKPGNQIMLRTGVAGTYMGKHHVLYKTHNQGKDRSITSQMLSMNKLAVSHKWMHVILEDAPPNVMRRMHILQNPPLAKIVNQSEITLAQAEAQVNHLMQTKGVHVNHSWWNKPMLVVAEPLELHQVSVQLNVTDSSATGVAAWFNQYGQGIRHKQLVSMGRLKSGELVSLTLSRNSGAQAQIMYESGFAQGEIRYVMKKGAGPYDVDDTHVKELCEAWVCVTTRLGNHVKVKFE